MRWVIAAVCIAALAAVLWLRMPKNADSTYSHDLPSAYGIVETTSSSTHASELQAAIRALEQGDFKAAEEIYRGIIRQDPKAHVAHHGLGSTLTYQKKYDEARQAFLSALAIAPDNASSYAGLGAIADIGKDHDEAIRQYKKSLSLNPQYGLAY